LLGAAASAAAWPTLSGRHTAAAASGPPLRLILWPSLNGAEAPYFWPNPGNLGAMSTVTAPLAPYQKQITFLRGVDITGSMNHMAVRSIFTGFPIADYLSPDPTVKSLDQVVADQFAAAAPTPLRSLHLGAIPADSIEFYQLYGRSTFFFAPKPVDYEANPVTAFDRLFKGATAPASAPGTPSTPAVSFEADVLDIVDGELADLRARVLDAPTELRKLDQHREAMRALRPASSAPGTMGTAPVAVKCDGGTLPSVEKLRPALQGNARAAYQQQHYSDIFDAQIDMVTRAVVCGLTRVATLQAGSADGNVTDPVGPGYPHHQTSHGNQTIFSQCQNWYATKFLRLLKGLDVPDPLDPSGKTVLHNSVVLWLSECMPVTHASTSVPCMLAGNAGGALAAGGYLDLKSVPNKAVLQTIASMMGAPGAPQFGTQTIAELRA